MSDSRKKLERSSSAECLVRLNATPKPLIIKTRDDSETKQVNTEGWGSYFYWKYKRAKNAVATTFVYDRMSSAVSSVVGYFGSFFAPKKIEPQKILATSSQYISNKIPKTLQEKFQTLFDQSSTYIANNLKTKSKDHDDIVNRIKNTNAFMTVLSAKLDKDTTKNYMRSVTEAELMMKSSGTQFVAGFRALLTELSFYKGEDVSESKANTQKSSSSSSSSSFSSKR